MDSLPINGLDLAVGIVLLISALLAFMRGFVHEVLSIAAWVGAVLASIHGQPLVRPYARSLIPLDWAADAATWVVIFLVVLLALSILTNAVSRSIQKSALNNLDRSLGFAFGLVRALVFLGIGLIITDWLTTSERPKWMMQAKTLPIIEMAADGVKTVLPATFMAAGDAAKDGAAKVNKALEYKETLDKLNLPALRAAEDDKSPPGANEKNEKTSTPTYKEQDQRSLDRLFEMNKE